MHNVLRAYVPTGYSDTRYYARVPYFQKHPEYVVQGVCWDREMTKSTLVWTALESRNMPSDLLTRSSNIVLVYSMTISSPLPAALPFVLCKIVGNSGLHKVPYWRILLTSAGSFLELETEATPTNNPMAYIVYSCEVRASFNPLLSLF